MNVASSNIFQMVTWEPVPLWSFSYAAWGHVAIKFLQPKKSESESKTVCQFLDVLE